MPVSVKIVLKNWQNWNEESVSIFERRNSLLKTIFDVWNVITRNQENISNCDNDCDKKIKGIWTFSWILNFGNIFKNF